LSFHSVIITIGDELLIGQTIDTNSAVIAQKLNLEGIHVQRRIAVADTAPAIITALNEVVPEVNLVILTGGLGPTADDITKPALANYFGGKLVTSPTVLQHIEQLFAKRNRPLTDKNRKQAEVPDACTILFNRMGTAPGMWFEKDNCVIISLPGVPFEMQCILEEEVLPRLRERFKGNHIYHKTLITLGVGESFIAEQIADIESALPPDIHLAYLPSPGMVKLRLSAEGPDPNVLKQFVDLHASLLQQRLGKIVAADEDLSAEDIVAKLLINNRLSVGLAESCTGGYVASRFTNIAGSSAFFKGGLVTYANEAKEQLLHVKTNTLREHGAVSEATVIQMAENARTLLNVDIALSISGILGPGGGTPEKPVGLVWMAICDKNRTETKKFQFYYDRIRNKELAAHAAFDMMRLFIERMFAH
jgi:nicotinamide-nucleotide amidase